MNTLLAVLLVTPLLAQTTWKPVGPRRTEVVEFRSQQYRVTWQQVRAVCASQQANDCEARVVRADVLVELGETLVQRKQRVCETAGCAAEDPKAWLKAALQEQR